MDEPEFQDKPKPDGQALAKPATDPAEPASDPAGEPGQAAGDGEKPVSEMTPEEQMAAFEKAMKEDDWGHQPC